MSLPSCWWLPTIGIPWLADVSHNLHVHCHIAFSVCLHGLLFSVSHQRYSWWIELNSTWSYLYLFLEYICKDRFPYKVIVWGSRWTWILGTLFNPGLLVGSVGSQIKNIFFSFFASLRKSQRNVSFFALGQRDKWNVPLCSVKDTLSKGWAEKAPRDEAQLLA